MITVGIIRNGATYLSHHLRKNDYWAAGEKEVRGEWIGEGSRALGLAGAVMDAPFDALRQNRHPGTGEPLTARDRENRVAFFDVQLSAPKDVSVLAMVGGDERIRDAFVESVKTALAEMERFAAVRERRGEATGTEAYRLTGNFVGALFLHDTSRDLDPQLHAHAVLANATWDAARNGWLALQPAEMLRASAYLRQVMYRELAGRLRALGYEPHGMNSKGFTVQGVEHLRERFSKRARHVQQLAEDYAKQKGRKPTKREIEVLVRESREDKLTEVSTPEVRARQRKELNADEARRLDDLVRAAQTRVPREQPSHGQARRVLEAALRHVYERSSVAREGDVLNAALELHPDFYRWRELTQALEEHPEIIRRDGEMSLRPIRDEETATVQRVQAGRNQRFALGDPEGLPATLTPGQRNAAKALLGSRDFLSVLVGDAGTGKTTLLTAVEQVHLLAGGGRFIALAPTTRARDALAENQGIGNGDAWLQSVTDNLFDVLLARASARGAGVLRTGIEAECDMHERWLRGGRKTGSIAEVRLPPAMAKTTWADAVETSLDIILGSQSSEVVASGLRATQAWVTAKPERIEPLFRRWSDDDWKTHWWLVLAERWAAEHPGEVEKTKSGLEEIARERLLHLRLQAWLVLEVLAASRGDPLSDFPDNPHYAATEDVPLAVPPKELLKTEGIRVGLSSFVDRFGGAESVLHRVEAAMGSTLEDVKRRIAHAVLQLPEPQKPTTYPAYLHAYGDVFCSLGDLGPVLSAAFEQKLADQPLSSRGVLRLAQGYLNGEDAWIATESPRPTRDADAWPGEKLLEPGYQVPTNRRALEKICHLLATQSEVPEDELVVGAKVDAYRNNEDFEFHFWFEESAGSSGTVDVPRPVTTINSRTFPWRAGRWFEQGVRVGRRPMVHFAGSLNLLQHAGVQVIPAELWSLSFGWRPRHENPLEWVSSGGLVARFERIHGPLRRIQRGHFRQPLLSRWLIKKAAWRTAVTKLATLKPVSALNSYPSDADR